MSDRRMLLITEGDKEKLLFSRLYRLYGEVDVDIVVFKTNIYFLYTLFEKYKQDYADLDLRTVLLENLKSLKHKERQILEDDRYSDILLVFDFDPHDPVYTQDRIIKMLNHFNDPTDPGKLYINYPMIESFYHLNKEAVLAKIEDPGFRSRKFNLKNITNYKNIVNAEGFQFDRRFDRDIFTNVILQHLKKGADLVKCSTSDMHTQQSLAKLLSIECDLIQGKDKEGFVVNTSSYIFPELYPKAFSL